MIEKHTDFIDYIAQYHFQDIWTRATDYQDMHQCTDIKIGNYNVAVRIRKNIKFRDFTIRAINNGYITQIDKILQGHIDYYIYAWQNEQQDICQYIIVDMKSAIKDRYFRHIINNRQYISNGDGSAHIAIRLNQIDDHIIDQASITNCTI